ncbi:MAG TPA: amino acid permease, partial [Gemmatimonadaceae bacterium]|nr:amino acid permease [Gemmatimonadaceae bacterium]
MGATIGSGIFRVPSTVAGAAGSVEIVALLWLIGAAITLFGALTIAELAAMYPSAGGLYVYLREAYGPLPAFLFGWTRLLVIQPTILGAIALIFAAYASAIVPVGDYGQRAVAGGLLAVIAAANVRSVGWGAMIQNVSTGAKVLALLVLSGLAFALGDGSGGALLAGERLVVATPWAAAGAALVAILWTYDGWVEVSSIAGEVRDPGRALPRALFRGTLTVVAVYLVVNGAYLWVLPLDAMAASSLVAADAA